MKLQEALLNLMREYLGLTRPILYTADLYLKLNGIRGLFRFATSIVMVEKTNCEAMLAATCFGENR